MLLLVFVLLFSSVFIEIKCLTPSELFNSLIVGLPSSPIGSTSSSVIRLPLANAQMLQQWVGQVAQQIVVEDGTFAGHYTCVAKKDMEKASLSVEMPQKELNCRNWQQSSSSESSFTRMFLTAYECVADKKFIGNEKNFLPFAIVSEMERKIEQLNIEKILLEKQNEEDAKSGLTGRRLQIHKDFALLSALNIQMTASDVIEFASFVHYALLRKVTGRNANRNYDNYLLEKMASYPRNLFEKRFLAENGLTIENIGQDPVKYRRIAHQLLIRLKNWGQNDLKEISERENYEIKLIMRDQCVFSIFTSNLMRRMANYALLDEYFGELNSARLSRIVKMEHEYFDDFFFWQNCNGKKGRTEENEEKGEERIYLLHFDEAIQIEWNIWKEIIPKIDQISEIIKNKKHKKQELIEYLESDEYEEGMRTIRAQFDGLELKVEKKKIIGIELEVMPKKKIEEFCVKLAEIKQISEQNIEQYEIQRNIVIEQKGNYAKFYDFLILVVDNFGRNIMKSEKNGKLQIGLNDANLLLDKMYELAKIVKSGEELNFKKAIKKILNNKLDENLKKLLNQFEEQNKFIKIKSFVEAQLFNLLFSFAVRLEAIVHGKKEDGTIKEEDGKKEGGKIHKFLAVLGKFNLPEWANNFSIFDYWMEIKNIKQNEGSSSSSLGVEIYRKLNQENDEALAASRESFKMLKRINEQKFSIYETTKMLREIYDAIDKHRCMSSGFVIPEIAVNLVDQIKRENHIKRNQNYWPQIRSCKFVKLLQNISKKFMKMMVDQGIDPQNQKLVEDKDFAYFCEKLKKEEEIKIALLNDVRYDLVIHFEFNRKKDIYEHTVDLLAKNELLEEITYREENLKTMINYIYCFTRETISKIEALMKKEEKDAFEIGKKFDELEELVTKKIEELEKAKEELKKLEKEREKKRITRKKIDELERQFKKETKKLRNLPKSCGEMLEKLKKHYEEKTKNEA